MTLDDVLLECGHSSMSQEIAWEIDPIDYSADANVLLIMLFSMPPIGYELQATFFHELLSLV